LKRAKEIASDYLGPEAQALHPINGFATAILKAIQAAEP